MYNTNDLRVTLLNKEEVSQFIKNHGIISCICYDTNDKYAEKVGWSCLNEGHTSGSRGDFFKFEIECPRYTADQIMRHEVGTFKNCQSQRYVDMDDNFEIYAPTKVYLDPELAAIYRKYEENCKKQYKEIRELFNEKGIKGEKANDLMRTMLPIGVKTKLRMGFTIEALINFMGKRLCIRADAPIREIATLMRVAILEVEPRYEKLLVPQCESKLYCPEKHSCGYYPTREELENIIEIGYDTILEVKKEEK